MHTLPKVFLLLLVCNSRLPPELIYPKYPQRNILRPSILRTRHYPLPLCTNHTLVFWIVPQAELQQFGQKRARVRAGSNGRVTLFHIALLEGHSSA